MGDAAGDILVELQMRPSKLLGGLNTRPDGNTEYSMKYYVQVLEVPRLRYCWLVKTKCGSGGL